MNSSIYLFIYTIVHSSTVVCMYLLIYAFIYSHIYLFIDLVEVAMYFCTYIHNKIAIIQDALPFEHRNSTWNIQKPAQHVLPILIPSTPIVLPSVQGHDVVGNSEILSLVTDVLQASCPQGLYAWHHLDIVDVVSILPSLLWLWCKQPRFESNAIKDKSHDLQDEEQVESRHDRRGQLAILVQGKRRPAVHLGIISWGVSWWNCTKWQHPTTDSCANRSLVVGVLWQHWCQDGTPCLGVSAKKETISRDCLTDRLSQTTPCDSKTNGIFMFHSMLPHILSCFFSNSLDWGQLRSRWLEYQPATVAWSHHGIETVWR